MENNEKNTATCKPCICRILSIICVSFLFGFFFGIHRKVIVAKIKGEPMPKAPVWHFWVKQ